MKVASCVWKKWNELKWGERWGLLYPDKGEGPREAERDRIRDQQINRSMFKNAKKRTVIHQQGSRSVH